VSRRSSRLAVGRWCGAAGAAGLMRSCHRAGGRNRDIGRFWHPRQVMAISVVPAGLQRRSRAQRRALKAASHARGLLTERVGTIASPARGLPRPHRQGLSESIRAHGGGTMRLTARLRSCVRASADQRSEWQWRANGGLFGAIAHTELAQTNGCSENRSMMRSRHEEKESRT